MRDAHGVVFARGGLPGERVEIEVRRAQKGVRHGVVLRVLEASPDRVTPDCALHPRCGGCDLLDLAPAAALAVRSGIVREALVRVGKIERDVVERALRPIRAPGPGDDARRRRVRVVIAAGRPTFSAPESHARVAVERCPALHPALDAALARLAGVALPDGTEVRLACDDGARVSAALTLAPTGEGAPDDAAGRARALVDARIAHGVLVLRRPRDGEGRDDEPVRRGLGPRARGRPGGNRAHNRVREHDDDDGDDDDVIARAGDAELVGEIGAGRFGALASDAGVFTQASRFGGGAILDEVRRATRADDDARPTRADDSPPAPRVVLELFAGAGHLTVPLLSAGARVIAVEGAARAVQFLERNVRTFASASVHRAFIGGALALPEMNERIDVLVADPPRTGIPGFDALLSRVNAPTLVLVSCDPATGARDIAIARKHGYALESVVPIDAFPRTSHVEWVARMTR